MSLWLWTFWTYSFLGYLLERGYAIATYAALLVFTADTVVSLQLLRRAGDPAVLSLGNLRAA